jgi:uncharacterized protein YndB with AHSA1/START domain
MEKTEAIQVRDDELFIERVFQAPVPLVWRLWEEPEHMIRWWGPEGFTATDLDVDFRPGGLWRIGMTSAAYPKSWSHGQFRTIEQDRLIQFIFAWDEGSGDPTETLITVKFIPEGDGTRQTFHQAPFASIEARDSHIQGWNSLFNKLQAHAEQRA